MENTALHTHADGYQWLRHIEAAMLTVHLERRAVRALEPNFYVARTVARLILALPDVHEATAFRSDYRAAPIALSEDTFRSLGGDVVHHLAVLP